MQPGLQDYKRFLVSLDPSRLADVQAETAALANELLERQPIRTAKRPHVAMPERRAAERLEVGVPGTYREATLDSSAPAAKRPVRILDASHTGYRFICGAPLRPLQVLALEFRCPGRPATRVLVQVMRVRGCRLPGRENYEIGCRALTPELATRARLELAHREAVRSALDNHPEIPVLQLMAGTGAQNARKWLRAKGYPVSGVPSARDVLPALRDAGSVSSARLLVCPAAPAAQAKAPIWLRNLPDEFPEVGILALAADTREYAKARWLRRADRIIQTQALARDMQTALEATLYTRLFSPAEAPPPATLKLLMAARHEKHLRRQQTLLAGEDFWIDKCRSSTAMRLELEMQMFDALIVTQELLEGNPAEAIAQLRADHPDLVLIVEAAPSVEPWRLMETETDLVLEPMASRKSLLENLARARAIARRRAFLR